MSSVERKDWYACVRCVLRCRAFRRDYYEQFGTLMAELNIGIAADVFGYIEDWVEEKNLNPKAICNAQFNNSGVCTCEFLAESSSTCTQNYFVHALPKTSFSYDRLSQICRGLQAYCVFNN